MSNDLHSRIEALATTFASSVLLAIRGASLEDILTSAGAPAPVVKRGRGRPRKDATPAPAASAAPSAPVKRGPGRPRKDASPAPAASAAPSAPVKRGPGRPKKASADVAPKAAAPKKSLKNGRLARRSQEQIDQTLADVVALVKKRPGLRAEQIRAELGLESKEMPRILATGLESKKLTKKGEKRATAYSAR